MNGWRMLSSLTIDRASVQCRQYRGGGGGENGFISCDHGRSRNWKWNTLQEKAKEQKSTAGLYGGRNRRRKKNAFVDTFVKTKR